MACDTLTLPDTRRALLAIIVRHLHARRDTILDRLDRQGWTWDPALSNELNQVDKALTDLGVYDTK